MNWQVRQLASGEIGDASHLLGRAFVDDPFIGHLLPDARRRQMAFPPFFRSVIHQQVELETVWVCEQEGRMVGVAAWFPPDPPPCGSLARLRAASNTAMVRGIFPRASAQLLRTFAGFDAHHPTGPHWYLAFIGVEPHAQGSGIGRALLEPALTQADSDQTPCYLETPYPETHAFYNRNGFELTTELHPIAGAPPVWTMTRPAQNTSAAIVDVQVKSPGAFPLALPISLPTGKGTAPSGAAIPHGH